MRQRSRFLAQSGVIAALYAALCFFQNLLLPGSGSWAIQFRVAECLCVLALFTPAAIPGLTAGCLLFNLTSAGALPLDFLVGSLATALSAGGMYLLRQVKLRGYPLPAMVLPAVWNGLLVGWELRVHIGGAFWLNAGYVALGELGVLLSLGTFLYYGLKARKLQF